MAYVIKPGSAKLLGHRSPKKSQRNHFLKNIPQENPFTVPLANSRRYDFFGKLGCRFSNNFLFFRKFKIHTLPPISPPEVFHHPKLFRHPERSEGSPSSYNGPSKKQFKLTEFRTHA